VDLGNFRDKQTSEDSAFSLSELTSETGAFAWTNKHIMRLRAFLKVVNKHINTPQRIRHFLKQQLEFYPGFPAGKQKRLVNLTI